WPAALAVHMAGRPVAGDDADVHVRRDRVLPDGAGPAALPPGRAPPWNAVAGGGAGGGTRLRRLSGRRYFQPVCRPFVPSLEVYRKAPYALCQANRPRGRSPG